VTAAVAAVLAGALFASASFAGPMTPAEKRIQPYSGNLPACDDGGVLSKISSRFSARESEFWDSGLEITGYDKVSEIGLRSTGLEFIPRRYCIARVTFNNGKVSTVNYAIAEDAGWLGVPFGGWGVDWCVDGLERNFAHGAGCKTARP
jgi:hypothetical protein